MRSGGAELQITPQADRSRCAGSARSGARPARPAAHRRAPSGGARARGRGARPPAPAGGARRRPARPRSRPPRRSPRAPLYGCLLSEEEAHVNSELWPAKVKNYLFRKAEAGTIDLHYRDYEEPPGNGGFLLNGGRLYLDMGHIEYASPECLHLHDLVTYELAGDDLLQSSLVALGAEARVSFIKNNVDHHTGATFGCHENYLMKREAQFTPPILGTLLTFLATRQIFTGSGRVGQSNPLAFDFEPPRPEAQVNFQLSQRADHIVNDI